MSYADDVTEAKLATLEKKIANEYSKAYGEMKDLSDKYFKTFQDRYNKEYKAYKEGKYTDDQFKAWYQNQIQRGEGYKKMCKDLADRMTNADQVANAYVNDTTPTIYSLNANHTAYQIEKALESNGMQADFQLVNEQAIKNLITNEDNVTEFKTTKLNPRRDYEWNSDQIRSAMISGIAQGKDINQLSEAFLDVMKRNKSSAIRNARTSYTSAQNAGRNKSAEQAQKMGIKVRKQWHSMEDGAVRFSHAMLDGQIRDLDKAFDNGCMYPADAKGRPEEVYNCRCRMEYILPEYMDDVSVENYSDDKQGDESYKEWIKRKQDEAKGIFKEPVKAQIKKIEYNPAKTLEEAEEFAKNNLTEAGRWMSNGVSYKGLSLEVANEINNTIYDFQQSFKVDKLSGISAPAKNTKLGKKMEGAHMGYNTLTGDLLINKDDCKTMSIIEKSLKEEKDLITNYLANPDRYTISSSYAKRIMDASAESGRSSVPENLKEALWHELGHSIQRAVINMESWESISKNIDSYSRKISGYATAMDHEYIAESFTSYMKGENKIDPELRKAFDALRR